MYGKTLEDFPDRFDAFYDALKSLSVDAMNMGFEWCMKNLTEFPVPAEVRQAAESEWQRKQFQLEDRRRGQEKRLAEAAKAQRFTQPAAIPERVSLTPEEREAEKERLGREFQEMLAAAKEKNRFGGQRT